MILNKDGTVHFPLKSLRKSAYLYKNSQVFPFSKRKNSYFKEEYRPFVHGGRSFVHFFIQYRGRL